MKMMIVVGARPNFMKAAPIIAAIRERNSSLAGISAASRGAESSEATQIQQILVHTGQHYDEAMSNSFFVDLDLPKPDVYLGVGSGSHAVQTAEIMRQFEQVLLPEKPDVLIVVGDVNSTVACALVAAKISYDADGTRPLIAHVEAGLRSFDRGMPEEVNRIATDHLSDLLFVTEESGIQNLQREGISDEKIHFVGNTMIDSLLFFKDKADLSTVLDRLGLRDRPNAGGATNGIRRYALLTLHRPSNVDNRETFENILDGLADLSQNCPIIFSAHPRTKKRIAEFGLEHHFQGSNGSKFDAAKRSSRATNGIRLIEPLGYLDFLCLMKNASLVVTDSGGIQEETTCLGVPCVTVRENTERPVTVTCGTNALAGTSNDGIRNAVKAQGSRQKSTNVPEKWDGKAAARIIEAVVLEFKKKGLEQVPQLR
jgi:UDP-N-acetylglucosamine 2-epimerase (non-hydrolysing)